MIEIRPLFVELCCLWIGFFKNRYQKYSLINLIFFTTSAIFVKLLTINLYLSRWNTRAPTAISPTHTCSDMFRHSCLNAVLCVPLACESTCESTWHVNQQLDVVDYTRKKQYCQQTDLEKRQHWWVGGANDDPRDSKSQERIPLCTDCNGTYRMYHSQVAVQRHQDKCIDACVSRDVYNVLINLQNKEHKM